ncbi:MULTISPECIES: energy transducer TonB [Flavobacterium]|uniref:Energy transducer TonB n=1 Tax=Flavobacterium covae TaxID=2906076 RepID=A0ABW8PH82_9FLAO|nr:MULTISPECIES: hypothetical protein [Flavobacterium]OXA74626.1 energy transducer TonB [Flavobacterium columnare] [Flavobacterium columnare NBRC 100251 = ATCC 23463]AMA49051.1 energy transducer TonB [Flavobacterium covae]AND64875.1 energy transducer TonB [Flavobacterium covae]MCJ1809933.1 energy transducer TonB [Flavobacterium covae]OWP80377.1 energy transducer TonB [Flavobacterium covae]
MLFLETPEEKKAFVITSVIFVILFFLFLFFGLTYVDPPPENGIMINFGTTDLGQGKVQPEEMVISSPKPKIAQPDHLNEEENILNNESTDAPVIKKTVLKEQIKDKKEEQKPSKSTDDALSSFINGPKIAGANEGHGNDEVSGDKGELKGSRYANSFYGSGSGVGGSGWGLKGRSLASRSRKVQDCNETGRVVVQVIVNRNGQVIMANYVKGTTNTNPCLVNPAIDAARAFRWHSDEHAPEKQIGFIVFNFEVGQ